MATAGGFDPESSLASAAEQAAVEALRRELGADLAALPAGAAQLVDVTGDVRLLRFLRGHGDEAAAAYRRMLALRKEHGLDSPGRVCH
jgi:hypothetical protein